MTSGWDGDWLSSNPDLPGANWADRHGTTVARKGLRALEATRMAIGRPPGWIRFLMRLRNAIVRLVGLRAAELSVDRHQIGAFPILSESPQKVVLGFNDWHLDFRIVVEAAPSGERTDVSVSTLVKRKNWFGYAYIFLITPFHVLIVRRLLANIGAPFS